MSQVHHFILGELKLAIRRSVPVEPLLDGLVQHGIIDHEEREILRGKKGMRHLIAKLRGNFQTFTLFVKCILEAGEKDPTVNTCIVNSIRGAAESFDALHQTNFTQEIPQKKYGPGVLESDSDDDSDGDCSEDGNVSMTSGYVSNSTMGNTPRSSFDDPEEQTDKRNSQYRRTLQILRKMVIVSLHLILCKKE